MYLSCCPNIRGTETFTMLFQNCPCTDFTSSLNLQNMKIKTENETPHLYVNILDPKQHIVVRQIGRYIVEIPFIYDLKLFQEGHT